MVKANPKSKKIFRKFESRACYVLKRVFRAIVASLDKNVDASYVLRALTRSVGVCCQKENSLPDLFVQPEVLKHKCNFQFLLFKILVHFEQSGYKTTRSY